VIFLTPEVSVIYILNTLFALFSTIAFVISLKIVRGYDREATTSKQYTLEKQSYLSATIIKYIFYIKIPLMIFFIFTLDKISFILPGAMCGAGVVNASIYAIPLLFLKLLNLYLFAYWLVMQKEDMRKEEQPYVITKFQLFLILYTLFIVEIILETLFFGSIDIKSVVDCCGAIFSHSDDTYLSLLLHMDRVWLLSIFYAVYGVMFLSYFLKQRYIFALINLLFLMIALIALIAFFGTYIYELPTHHCPFCLLQKDYHYIGYLLYLLLFLGTFNGLVVAMIGFDKDDIIKRERYALFFNSLYTFVVTLYPLLYFYKNGVWL